MIKTSRIKPARQGETLHKKPACITMAGHLAIACWLCAGFASPAMAQTLESVEVAGTVVLEDPYPPRERRFANSVTGLADVVFATHSGYRPLRLDLYLPPGAQQEGTNHPLLVVIHGGGWQAGHTRHFGAFANWPEALAAIAFEGFVVASVEYRLSGEAPFPAAFEDVRAAIRWLRTNAVSYGIDPSRVVAFGGSAGGQLAALVGTSCGKLENSGNSTATPVAPQPVTSPESACVQGVVAWYGVFDFAPLINQAGNAAAIPGPIDRYLACAGGPCNPEVVVAASPINWVDAADPPFLLVHGIDDTVVPVQQSRLMDAALKGAGVDSTLIEIPAVEHSFIGSTPAATRNASRQAWEASIEFIRKVLRNHRQDAG